MEIVQLFSSLFFEAQSTKGEDNILLHTKFISRLSSHVVQRVDQFSELYHDMVTLQLSYHSFFKGLGIFSRLIRYCQV